MVDGQSESDLDSIRNSCDVFIFNTSKMGVKGHVNGDKKYVDDVDSEF